MNFEKWLEVAKSLGFPVVVAGYVLWNWTALSHKLIENQAIMIELIRQHVGVVEQAARYDERYAPAVKAQPRHDKERD